MFASIVHAAGREGYSIAFRYMNPPMPMRTIKAIPRRRLFIYE